MSRLPLLGLVVGLAACSDLTAPSPSGTPAAAAAPTTPTTPTTAQVARPAAPAPAIEGNQPAKIRASHVLVAYQGAQRAQATRSKDDAKKLAETLLGRLRGGADFSAVAKENSDDPSAKTRGGDLGQFDRFTMTKPFADAAFGLRVGQLSGVVETEFGFHIIKRTE
ncbi:MAG: peptidylprolyl isomerase [Polyangiaceae bacterium]